MPNEETIELVCVTDANYAPHFSALLKSIETHKGPENLRVHAILDSVGSDLLAQIRAASPALEVIDYHVDSHPALNLPPIMHISRATYLRLIMTEMLPPEIDRVLYLDIDMLVTRNLLPLWRSDMHGYPVAAVQDHNLSATKLANTFGLPGEGRYFNAGMLLVDLKAERANGYLTKALDCLIANPSVYEFADQDALNQVLWQNWTILDNTWNFQRAFVNDNQIYRDSGTDQQNLPGIIHFTERWKPWKSDEWHPYAWLYWKYLRQTPFFDEIRKRDRIGYGRLLKFWLKYQLAILRSRVAAS
ncbi:glycosyltransferase family 8 protein [Cognatishimia activa]|uniref:General stress protein A n=1 Tax=Cognatishimia activa TaxID=1715691 RepID=A0A0P1IVT8_9RHOB|nr:glycosyltransferase family 8 protein [Cognatishimia activa]CUJ18739.1 General stress protein A [Cognatishimia activa]CUK27609.1 General stress protein A [Cognatishimia activa]